MPLILFLKCKEQIFNSSILLEADICGSCGKFSSVNCKQPWGPLDFFLLFGSQISLWTDMERVKRVVPLVWDHRVVRGWSLIRGTNHWFDTFSPPSLCGLLERESLIRGVPSEGGYCIYIDKHTALALEWQPNWKRFATSDQPHKRVATNILIYLTYS